MSIEFGWVVFVAVANGGIVINVPHHSPEIQAAKPAGTFA
jgi:hypothetical protein